VQRFGHQNGHHAGHRLNLSQSLLSNINLMHPRPSEPSLGGAGPLHVPSNISAEEAHFMQQCPMVGSQSRLADEQGLEGSASRILST
jgi:hypothetical protein